MGLKSKALRFLNLQAPLQTSSYGLLVTTSSESGEMGCTPVLS